MLRTESLKPLKTKTAKTILMGNDKYLHLILAHRVHNLVEPSTVEIQPATDFLNVLDTCGKLVVGRKTLNGEAQMFAGLMLPVN
jgi:hypothetical protein